MKVYGFTSWGVMRGEMAAFEIPAGTNLLDAMDGLGVELEWEEAHVDFRFAQRRMVAAMVEEGLNPEDIQVVRDMRAGDVYAQVLTVRDPKPHEIPWNVNADEKQRPVIEVSG